MQRGNRTGECFVRSEDVKARKCSLCSRGNLGFQVVCKDRFEMIVETGKRLPQQEVALLTGLQVIFGGRGGAIEVGWISEGEEWGHGVAANPLRPQAMDAFERFLALLGSQNWDGCDHEGMGTLENSVAGAL